MTRCRIFFLEIPAPNLCPVVDLAFAPAQAYRAVWHDELATEGVKQQCFPFRIIGLAVIVR